MGRTLEHTSPDADPQSPLLITRSVKQELHRLKRYSEQKGRTESLGDVVARLVHDEKARQAA